MPQLKNKYSQGRLLRESFVKSLNGCTYSNAKTCDADASCSWCKSAAVASSCKSLEDAKNLPKSIFACDKISAFEEV